MSDDGESFPAEEAPPLPPPSRAPSGSLIMDGSGTSETEAAVGVIGPCVRAIVSRLLKMDKAAVIGLWPTRHLRGDRWSIRAFSVL